MMCARRCAVQRPTKGDIHMTTWSTPAYCEIRLGFEVTAYVYVR